MPRARRLLLAVYLACPVVSIPTFFLYTVEEITVADEDSSSVYIVNLSSNKLLKEVSLWQRVGVCSEGGECVAGCWCEF